MTDTARPSTVGAFLRVLNQLPDHAELHIYVHGTTTTVQAEWVDDENQIQNPVILRATHELFGAGAAETWPDAGAEGGRR
jgi:hypothetical protein